MPAAPEHPATLGDLRVVESETSPKRLAVKVRPATVADLVSALRAEGVRTFSADFVATWRFCPRCGRPNIDQPREEGVERCGPGNCDVWVHEATFNHSTRQWDPTGVSTKKCEYCDDGTVFIPHRSTCDRCHGTGVDTDALAEAQPFPPAGGSDGAS